MMVRLLLPALTLCLALCGAGRAGEAQITDAELKARLAEADRRVGLVAQKQMKADQLLDETRRATKANVSPRERAIRHFLLAHTLKQVVREGMAEARKEYHLASEAWADFPGAYIAEADLADRLGEKDSPLVLVDKALSYHGEYGPAILLLARISISAKDYARAKRLCERAMDAEMSGEACELLATACAFLAEGVYNPAEKKALIDKAIAAAEARVALEPDSGYAHLFRASFYVELGHFGAAAKALEESLRVLPEGPFQPAGLRYLLHVQTRLGRMAGVKETLGRLLKCERIQGEDRENYARMLDQVEKKGDVAIGIWQVEKALAVVKNDGISASVRRDSLKELLGLLVNPEVAGDERLREVREEVIRCAFRVMVDAPPEVAVEVIRFFRTSLADPRLIRILVHFVYPYANERITPEVRVEAIRTIAAVCGPAALPTILHSLKDESGMVQREADRALSTLCEARSVVGDGLEPLTLSQAKQVRTAWRAYITSEEGDRRLVAALASLAGIVDMDPGRNRELKANPVADHVTQTILLDKGARWAAWSAAYDFLVRYLNKEFRPVAQRDKPVTPGQRDAILGEIERFWAGSGLD